MIFSRQLNVTKDDVVQLQKNVLSKLFSIDGQHQQTILAFKNQRLCFSKLTSLVQLCYGKSETNCVISKKPKLDSHAIAISQHDLPLLVGYERDVCIKLELRESIQNCTQSREFRVEVRRVQTTAALRNSWYFNSPYLKYFWNQQTVYFGKLLI